MILQEVTFLDESSMLASSDYVASFKTYLCAELKTIVLSFRTNELPTISRFSAILLRFPLEGYRKGVSYPVSRKPIKRRGCNQLELTQHQLSPVNEQGSVLEGTFLLEPVPEGQILEKPRETVCRK